MPPKKKACNGQLLKDLLDDSEHLKAVKEEFGRCVVLQRRHTGELAKALENVVAFEREKYISRRRACKNPPPGRGGAQIGLHPPDRAHSGISTRHVKRAFFGVSGCSVRFALCVLATTTAHAEHANVHAANGHACGLDT